MDRKTKAEAEAANTHTNTPPLTHAAENGFNKVVIGVLASAPNMSATNKPINAPPTANADSE
jgi:hypothetical protein